MEVRYRKAFLKDLKRLKGLPVYDKVFELVFVTLPEASTLSEIVGVKAMRGHANRFRICIGPYRVGIEVRDDKVELVRVLHRRDFYRHFP